MENAVQAGSSPDSSAALLRAQRQYASLEQAAGWLVGTLQIDVGNPPPASAPVAERLRHVARELGWAGGHDRLIAFAERFEALRAEWAHAGADSEAVAGLAFRLEQAASQGLALYVEAQAQSAARSAELAADLPEEGDEEGRLRHMAEIGARVRAKLDAHPRAEKLPANGLEIYAVPGFLSREECEGIIRLIDQDLIPSGLLGEEQDQEFRTSKSCNLKREEPLVDMVDARLSALVGIHRRFAEMVQGQRYEVGQQFKPHHDFFHKGQPYYEAASRMGGQRSWTGMLFLNEVEGGGFTNFPMAGLKVTPEAGKLLVWNNMSFDGTPNPASLHQGMPVEAGIKYVITKWFRERPAY